MSVKNLAQTIAARVGADPSESWTAKLLANPDKAAEKFGEEAVEAIIEATKGDKARLTSEAADVMYHLLVMCAAHGVTLDDIEAELANRTAQSGIAEKASR
ncbi:phosphoribosyl-ATP diphosphatase [Octadecabacter sp. 1_MG-2023]|uniref:phosphoribosyl-ATP diphosphatase n=1 Tax=unclassified Octadecabacter TaxID=196158 RepID=UPI001C0A1468|nr:MULTISPECIES: phosphoribosyl-ATP diphosphatase [unclassified Octadecabacter]MBU2992896.1 phosphoribosyl-ATP diphosphatase [Octadecabacter sp. B2R22]MDO6733653.1 phosphoribosyl-ATP diphosphatase [Octadecabacter sp. 1_MG-2023]